MPQVCYKGNDNLNILTFRLICDFQNSHCCLQPTSCYP